MYIKRKQEEQIKQTQNRRKIERKNQKEEIKGTC